MLRSINHCYQNKKLATFYCEEGESQKLFCGYVEKYNNSEILIAHISPHGYYDGLILMHIEDIWRVDYDGDYEKKIGRLYKLREQSHKHIHAIDMGEEILYTLLDFAKQNDYIISIEFSENRISGFVNDYTDDNIYLGVVNEFGAENGTSIINVDEILCIAVDSDYEQDLKLLCT